ncbi:NifB/NifX family molybdenum-iron cluster-binding protein [Vibrio sp.]|uniref:NifB/NifX family molybdenum-iron cluster-binding protein n=1 Tax=Vibrio sp. TaxID=678 RepID=UPI003AA89DEB
MLFAIPCRETSLFNHFSMAPQIMLWNSQTNSKRIFELPKSSPCCGHKHLWRKVIEDNRVDAVVVRSIGSNMLSALFKLNVKVLSAPRGFCLDDFDDSRLTPVTEMAFARQSHRKNKANYSRESSTHASTIDLREVFSGDKVPGQCDLNNKLSPQALKHLTKVFKSTDQPEK